MPARSKLLRVLAGLGAGVVAIGITHSATERFGPVPAAASSPPVVLAIPPAGTRAYRGYELFLLNCAHCHGNDARGDEGPDLRGLTKSDPRIATIIQDGLKGEMPKFGTKLDAADTQALIAFLRTLKK